MPGVFSNYVVSSYPAHDNTRYHSVSFFVFFVPMCYHTRWLAVRVSTLQPLRSRVCSISNLDIWQRRSNVNPGEVVQNAESDAMYACMTFRVQIVTKSTAVLPPQVHTVAQFMQVLHVS